MKLLLPLVTLIMAFDTFAQSTPDFRKIFSEIEETNTVTEAISVRERNLRKMRNLDDFSQLVALEKLNAGQEFFSHYQNRMGDFILKNVGSFINPERKSDELVFTLKLLPKVKDSSQRLEVAKLGLAYVSNCEDFQRYASQTEPALKRMYMKTYCKSVSSPASELINVLTKPRILQEGRWDMIKFDYAYVKKIYISAEGVRNDAYFDVMVNGDIKGTIYVPGRDPSYVVTVESYTDTLLLRSLSGKAKISMVILEIQ